MEKTRRGNPRFPQIAQTLRETNADIILLQECDRFLLRSGAIHQARVLAGAVGSGVHFRFYGRLRFGPLAFGNALLSRVPLVKTFHVPLHSSGGEPRCALGVRLENGATLWNTHLGLRDTWRHEQLTILANAINAQCPYPDAPILVGGDLNARKDAPEITAFLKQTGLIVLGNTVPTFPNSAPAHQIDFLFGRNVATSDFGVIAAPGSDHCLLWADIEPNRSMA